MNVIDTARLGLRPLDLRDAGFILELLNQETFLRHIGDKGVRNLADACEYLMEGPMASYRRHGFGLYMTLLRETGVPVGICGLVKRNSLPDPDLGFALMPQHCGMGYAVEAAAAVLDYGTRLLRLARIVAIVSPDNQRSVAVIEKVGLRYERSITLAGETKQLRLYGPPLSRP